MDVRQSGAETKRFRAGKLSCVCFLLLLICYPLRRLNAGVDLWDGGYNYANFMFAGLEHMDSMWYFATWIATQAGALLMKLPFADTMRGMNLYTGLIVSLLATAGFLFCVKILKLPGLAAFACELAASSLCWAPTSALYNYLTYLLLLAGSVCLYLGLLRNKDALLVLAGAALGLNVGVRFSNLVQAGLILAVWVYALTERKSIKQVLRETALCMLGYFAAAGAFLLLMGLRYGLGAYFEGIFRLFQMTETAADYAPSGMLSGMFKAYWESAYWLKRYLLVFAVMTVLCLILPGRGEKIKKALCALLTGGLMCWLLTHRFVAPNYITYDAIYNPCVTVFALTFCLALFFLTKRDSAREERLAALFSVLTIFLSSLGSNNAVYSSINNLFLALPFLLYMIGRLFTGRRSLMLFPAKALLTASVLLLFVQAMGFGRDFIYEEAAGGAAMDCQVTGIPVLEGMKTEEEKALRLTQLYDFLRENGLLEREVLLYGEVPGLAYYMELAPALNIWGDLRSYAPEVMRADLEKLGRECAGGRELPAVILGGRWAGFLEDPGLAADYWDRTAVEKLGLVGDFMEDFSYEKAFDNGKYVVFLKNTE